MHRQQDILASHHSQGIPHETRVEYGDAGQVDQSTHTGEIGQRGDDDQQYRVKQNQMLGSGHFDLM